MQRHYQSGQLVFLDILEFVYEESDATVIRLSGNSHHFKQVLQVCFQVAIVRQARFGIEIEPNFNVLIFHFQCGGRNPPMLSALFGHVPLRLLGVRALSGADRN